MGWIEKQPISSAASVVSWPLRLRTVDGPGLARDDLAEQRILGDLEFDRQAGRGEGKRADGRGLGPHARGVRRVAGGVESELREFGVDVVPREGVLPSFDKLGRDGLPGAQSLPQCGEECFVVPAFGHHAHLPVPLTSMLGSGSPRTAVRCGERRSRFRQRARVGPMLPTGMPKVALISA